MNTNPDRDDSVTLNILDTAEQNEHISQRDLSRKLGVALGLANSYLKRCVRKGLIKVQQAPANRYLYYLTPKGFSEKSRLTVAVRGFRSCRDSDSADFGAQIGHCWFFRSFER